MTAAFEKAEFFSRSTPTTANGRSGQKKSCNGRELRISRRVESRAPTMPRAISLWLARPVEERLTCKVWNGEGPLRPRPLPCRWEVCELRSGREGERKDAIFGWGPKHEASIQE